MKEWIYGSTNPHFIFRDGFSHVSKIHIKPRLATYSEWFVEEGKGVVLPREESLYISNIEKVF